MASNGDTITYTFSGIKETENISTIDEITIDRMDGAEGGENSSGSVGSRGGLIQSSTADVSSYSTLEIWVGKSDDTSGYGVEPFGRADGGTSGGPDASHGGGSTELWTDSNSVFIAAADAAGGRSSGGSPVYGASGGARGGAGGDGSGGFFNGQDAGGTGFGGDGGGVNGGSEQGGQELGIASGGTTTKGGANAGSGEIKITFTKTASAPAAPSNLSATLSD